MLYHAEPELASLLAAWPAAEDRIVHLYELDPTHVAAAQTVAYARRTERQSVQESRSSLPFCLLSDEAPVPAMLELDPTHVAAH
ncbi:MAG TPA: hypothetical protein VGE12_00520 [Noviherbaspirillum sp.]